ncbi:S-layer homology domain-containing protein [Clostridium formicaceticum]|uniref:Endo-1,4-beta-xylanase A n=1 Tax=Clostridium formicaceticum TaxID=1497 RepID=A0AAC9RNZ7_9CLOT|nr:S-layer homology domain-containing protein [Clostridium formicaceticum]AOY77759.1 hypothetical protein BJL90_18980 [Clostridium formicaceticum]ARE88358.1 Endo-1,4-beta-xylanase A precursor [Clostridium formicaceticum]
MKKAEFSSIVKLSSVTLVLLMLLNIVFFGGADTAWANESHDHSSNDITARVEQDENHDDHSSNDVITVIEQGENHDGHSNDDVTAVIEQEDPHNHTNDEGTGFTVSGKILGITEGEQVELKLKQGDGICQDIMLEEGEVTYSFKNVLPDDYIICIEIDNVTVGMIPIKVEDSDITEDLYIKQISGVITGLKPGINAIITLIQPDIDMEMVSGPINLMAEGQELNYSIKAVPGSYYLKVFYPDYGEYLSEEIVVGKEDCTLEPIEMIPALRITTESLPGGTTGVSYTASLEAEAVTPYGVSPYNWEISSGSLPPGLQLEALFGKITGIPLQDGNFSFDIRVKNLYGYTAVKQFPLDIASHSSDDESSDESDIPEPEGTFSDDYLQQAINQANDKIILEADAGIDEVIFTKGQLVRLIEENKPVVLYLNEVRFTFNPGILDIPQNATVSFKAQVVNEEDIEDLVNNTSFKLADKIYEFKIIVFNNGVEEEVGEFSEAIAVTFSTPEEYWQDESHVTLDAFYLNEKESNVQPLQASHDIEGKTLTFTTNHFSKYAVLSMPESTDNATGETDKDDATEETDKDDSTGETDNDDSTEEIDNVSDEKFVPEFTDIKGHWAYNDILEMARKGFIRGYEDNSFRPEANITRAEFATILVKILKLEEKADLTFKDVLPDQWYFENIAKAYQAGIIRGYTPEEFRPNEFSTREQIAVMTAKAMIYAGIDFEKIGDMTLDMDIFADKELVADWAKESVVKILRANITKGVPLEGQVFFYPNKKASRAEAAVMLLKLSRIL